MLGLSSKKLFFIAIALIAVLIVLSIFLVTKLSRQDPQANKINISGDQKYSVDLSKLETYDEAAKILSELDEYNLSDTRQDVSIIFQKPEKLVFSSKKEFDIYSGFNFDVSDENITITIYVDQALPAEERLYEVNKNYLIALKYAIESKKSTDKSYKNAAEAGIKILEELQLSGNLPIQ